MSCNCRPTGDGLCWVQGDPASVTLRLTDDGGLDLTTVDEITLTVARDNAGRTILLTLPLAAISSTEATGTISAVDVPAGSWWWDIIAVVGGDVVLRTEARRVQVRAGVGHV